MYILENALISIKRNKSRNILIGIIILVISCACTITLAINNTASDLINSYQSAYDKELTINFDRGKMMGDEMDFSKEESREEMQEKFANIENLSISLIEKLAKVKHIESYYYTYDLSLNGQSISKAEMTNDDKKPDNMPEGKEDNNSLDFTLTGYSSLSAMSEFIEGTYNIKEITDDAWDKAFDGNYVFINYELASYNNLSLGDSITLEDENNNTYSFEIIGIYEENEDGTNNMSMFANSANTIITNATCLTNITKDNDSIVGNINPTFIIDNYDNADKIQEEFYEEGLDENYVVSTNEEEATASLSGITNVKSFAVTFLIITLAIGGIVLVIINMINIRERKYEIGVLRTIGMSKFKLTMQFVLELIIVAIVSLSFGAIIGSFSSKSVSNMLLSSEIDSTSDSTEMMKDNFNPSDNSNNMPDLDKISSHGVVSVQAYDSIDAVVNIWVIIELLGICLSLVLLSSISAMISIQRFSPLTILKERT